MIRSIVLLMAIAIVCLAPSAMAHETRPGYLELKQTSQETYDVLWKVPAAGDEMRLGLYVRFPAQTGETREHRGLFIGGAFVERWSVRHPGGLTGQTIHIDGLRSTMTDVLVRIERLDGTTLVKRVEPSHPSLVVAARPSAFALVSTYFELGVEHILLGIDHLLFVLALLLLVQGWKRAAGTITAFTVAHSVTLALATLEIVRVSGPPVEAIIALSIVFVAREIVHSLRGRDGLAARRPWIVAFVFGLLHGLGFASALREIGLPQQAIPLSLLFFNIGVEAGQLLFISVAAGLAIALRKLRTRLPEYSKLVTSYAIGGIAIYWVFERVVQF